ncbi:MAG: hypothetical protein WB975_12825 [Nitrososphaeraceae archaeon]
MVSVSLLVRMQAKPGKETDVENFLRGDCHWFKKSQLLLHLVVTNSLNLLPSRAVPPSIKNSIPVIKLLSLDGKNKTALASSSQRE